jgi:hypothetical protein
MHNVKHEKKHDFKALARSLANFPIPVDAANSIVCSILRLLDDSVDVLLHGLNEMSFGHWG